MSKESNYNINICMHIICYIVTYKKWYVSPTLVRDNIQNKNRVHAQSHKLVCRAGLVEMHWADL